MEVEVEGLAVVCAGLGCVSQDPGARYIKSDHCLENLKNLQRFLRRDHPTSRPVFKQLGKWNTVSQDLVPIIVHYRDAPELVINAIKVVVFLTMPVDALSDGVSQQTEYIWNFKASFLENDAIAVILTLVEEPLEHLESESFSEDDWKVVQLVLTLVRNLLDIQDPPMTKAAVVQSSTALSIRDQLLQHLFQENVMELLLALALHVAGTHGLLRQDSLLFLEIFHHIFWGQSAEKIARANETNCKDNHMNSSSGLLRVMMEEEKEQLKTIRLRDISRHSRFSGTFVRVAEDGSKRMLKRNPFQSLIETVLKGPRFKHGPVKRIACEGGSCSTSKGKLLELLKSFADQTLAGAYNVVMQAVKDDIRREKHGIQTADVTLFFGLANFFTAYQRYRISDLKGKGGTQGLNEVPDSELNGLFQGQLCGPIASTMDEEMFRMVISRWHEFSESAKETKDWVPLTVTGTLIKEMIWMLDLVLKVAQSTSREEEQELRVTRILLYKVFYDQTEKGIIQFLLHLLKSFDIHKQPRSHLADLIETVHIVLRILEFLTDTDGSLRVLKKSRKGNRRKTQAKDTQLEQTQSSVIDLGNSCPDNSLNADIVNSDANMVSNGAGHVLLEENASSEIFKGKEEMDTVVPAMDSNQPQHVDEVEKIDAEEEAEQEEGICHIEVSLDVHKCSSLFADNTVIHNYCWLLKYYESNSAATNHYILCMLQRVYKEHSLKPMLFQLSLFRTFYEILSNGKAANSEEHKSLFAFLTKLVRSFFKKLKMQPLLFLDILFWKTRQECHLVSCDYEIQALRRAAGRSGNRPVKNSIADALGNDDFDAGCPPLDLSSDELGIKGEEPQLFEKSNSLKLKRGRKGAVFTAEQESQLKDLFEQHKEDKKCCLLLAQALDSEGKITAAQVRRKLRLLNLNPLHQHQSRNKVDHGNDSMDHEGVKKRGVKKCTFKRNQLKGDMVDTESDEETLSQIMKKKGVKKPAFKRNQLKGDTIDIDRQESDDETLTQIMNKVRSDNSGRGENDARVPLSEGSKKKPRQSKDLKAKQDKDCLSEEQTSEDPTIQDPLTRENDLEKNVHIINVDANTRNVKDGEAFLGQMTEEQTANRPHEVKYGTSEKDLKGVISSGKRKRHRIQKLGETQRSGQSEHDESNFDRLNALEDHLEKELSGDAVSQLIEDPHIDSEETHSGKRHRNLFVVDDDE